MASTHAAATAGRPPFPLQPDDLVHGGRDLEVLLCRPFLQHEEAQPHVAVPADRVAAPAVEGLHRPHEIGCKGRGASSQEPHCKHLFGERQVSCEEGNKRDRRENAATGNATHFLAHVSEDGGSARGQRKNAAKLPRGSVVEHSGGREDVLEVKFDPSTERRRQLAVVEEVVDLRGDDSL